jgi:hypothetical protein
MRVETGNRGDLEIRIREKRKGAAEVAERTPKGARVRKWQIPAGEKNILT